jgi:hypothetical protein
VASPGSRSCSRAWGHAISEPARLRIRSYQDASLKLTTGEARSVPFAGTGSFFTSRALVGVVSYSAGGTVCYPNCDGSTSPPILNVNDFICFNNQFAVGDSYANCDASTSPPILNVNDFTCFLNSYATGCP